MISLLSGTSRGHEHNLEAEKSHGFISHNDTYQYEHLVQIMDESLAIYCKCEEADYRERCDWSSMIEMTKFRMIRHGYCSPGAAE